MIFPRKNLGRRESILKKRPVTMDFVADVNILGVLRHIEQYGKAVEQK